MAAIITNKFRINNAEQFVESFRDRRNNDLLSIHRKITFLGEQMLMFKAIQLMREQTLPKHQMMM